MKATQILGKLIRNNTSNFEKFVWNCSSRITLLKNRRIFSANTTNWASEDEKVATLSFVLIDKNINKVWERKEWKRFRELVTAARFVV